MSMKIQHTLVYLVDDDEDDRFFFEEALEEISRPTKIASFSNGVDLMANLLGIQQLPDVIFIDLNMPLMNGEECIVDIRKEDEFDNVPLVVYSTASDEEQLYRLKDLGAHRYLQKPNTFTQLKVKLENALNEISDESKLQDATYQDFIIS